MAVYYIKSLLKWLCIIKPLLNPIFRNVYKISDAPAAIDIKN